MRLNEGILRFSSDMVTKNLQEAPFSVHRLIFIETSTGPLACIFFAAFCHPLDGNL